MLFRILVMLTAVAMSSQIAQAQIAGEDLPDMSDLQSVFGAISSGEKDIEVVTDENGLIGSGIAVPDTGAMGEMAKQLAQAIGQAAGEEGMADVLHPAFEEAVTKVEDALPELGFQKRDYGVGFAFFFIMNWEIANGANLSPEAYMPAAEKLVKTVQSGFEGQEMPADDALDKQYDLYLTIPTAILTMVQSFEAEGQAEAAAQMREYAGQAFEQVLGISPYDIDITDEGEIVGY